MTEEQFEIAAAVVALEQTVAAVLSELCRADPHATPIVASAFDIAANTTEKLSIEYGDKAKHFTRALKYVEEMRAAVLRPAKVAR